MKKCPGCRSIVSDEDSECGVCGRSLLGVSPMEGTIEDSAREDQAEEAPSLKRESQKELRRLHKGVVTGLTVGTGLILLGGWVLLYGWAAIGGIAILAGILLMMLGAVTVETVFGLFDNAPYHGWLGWVSMKYLQDAEEREKEIESD